MECLINQPYDKIRRESAAQDAIGDMQDVTFKTHSKCFCHLDAPDLILWKRNKFDEVKDSDLDDRSMLDALEILDVVFQDETKH